MPSVNLRLTDEQHATLVAAAEGNHRSMQGEIIHRLFPPPDRILIRDGAGNVTEIEEHFKPDPKPQRAEKAKRR